MVVNGLKLPEHFVRLLESGHLKREVGCRELKRNVDAYGNPLDTELAEVFSSSDEIAAATSELAEYYMPEGDYGDEEQDEPGYIPDITDFTQVVRFANSADGAPFCFDFRERPDEPSVVWWADAYWRRVAPDFDSFINLFDLRSS